MVLGARPGYIGFTSPTEKFNTYTVDWTPVYIKVYYNNKLVRQVTDPDVLKQLEGKTMNVIINNGVQNSYPLDINLQTELMARNFRYIPYKELN